MSNSSLSVSKTSEGYRISYPFDGGDGPGIATRSIHDSGIELNFAAPVQFAPEPALKTAMAAFLQR